MVYGMLAVFTSMGWAYLTLILSHCVLLYSISLVKLRWLCFTAGLATLATFKMEPFLSWQVCVEEMPVCQGECLFVCGCGGFVVCVACLAEQANVLRVLISVLEDPLLSN